MKGFRQWRRERLERRRKELFRRGFEWVAVARYVEYLSWEKIEAYIQNPRIDYFDTGAQAAVDKFQELES